MAYSEELGERIRAILADREGVSERKMFGGLCFLIHNNMACGVVKNELMVRVGKEMYDEMLMQPNAREMDFTGRPLRGMVYINAKGIASDQDLAMWIERGVAHAASLPPK